MSKIEDQPNPQTVYIPIQESLQKIGGLLKQARESKNISIEELSKTLRMGEEQIIAIESGQEDLLPEDVFIKAMIRRISEKLGVEIITDTRRIDDEDIGSSCDSYSDDPKAKKSTPVINSKLLTITGLSILTLIIGISLPKLITKDLYQIDSYNETTVSPSTEKASEELTQ